MPDKIVCNRPDCKHKGVLQPLSNFYIRKKPDKYYAHCKDCYKKTQSSKKNPRRLEGTKHCNKCKEVYHVDSFYSQGPSSDGLMGMCKFCVSKKQKARKPKKRVAHKKCKECKNTYHFMIFADEHRSSDGLAAICKICLGSTTALKVVDLDPYADKVCRICERELQNKDYYLSGLSPYGISYYCKKCESERKGKKNSRRLTGLKYCVKCCSDKDVSLFYTNSKTPDGLDSQCKSCTNSRKKKERVGRYNPRKEHGTSFCSKCKEEKDVEEFWSNPLASNGLNYQCSSCRSDYFKCLNKPRREDGTKVCVKCGFEKGVSGFKSNNKRVDGLESQCMECYLHFQIEGQKPCSACNEVKHVSHFSISHGSFDGLNNRCKECDHAVVTKKDYPVSVSEKECSKCNLLKESECFSKQRRNSEGLNSWCSACVSNNKEERVNVLQAEGYKKVNSKVCTACKVKKDISMFPKKKDAFDGHEGRCKYCRNQWALDRLATDINFKLSVNLRKRLGGAVKKGQKSGSAVRDLGCSIPEFKEYLHSKFYPHPDHGYEMSTDNYGENHNFPEGWHMDHIKPLALFDLTDRGQFLEACHFTNYQPLWYTDHQNKTKKDLRDIADTKK